MINLDENQKEIIAQTVERYGNKQLMQAVEEMAELMQAISKYTRTDPSSYNDVTDLREKITENKNNIVEEMADVYIMLEQLQCMLDIKNEDIQAFIEMKLNRQQVRNEQFKKRTLWYGRA